MCMWRSQAALLVHRCPFPFELNVGAVVRGLCGVGALGHALAAILVIPTQSERQKQVQVSLSVLQFKCVLYELLIFTPTT